MVVVCEQAGEGNGAARLHRRRALRKRMMVSVKEVRKIRGRVSGRQRQQPYFLLHPQCARDRPPQCGRKVNSVTIAFLQQTIPAAPRVSSDAQRSPYYFPRAAMTILSIHGDNPLADGRQSERAMKVRRGVQRLLMELRHAALPELTLRAEAGRSHLALAEGRNLDYRDQDLDRGLPRRSQVAGVPAPLRPPVFATHAQVPLDIFRKNAG